MNKLVVAAIGIAVAGSLGALARYGIWWASNTYITTRFPVGTLLINASGAFCIGLLSTALDNSPQSELWRLIFSVGFLGAFTTFSSMMLETDTLVFTNAAFFRAALYLALSLF